MIHPIFSHVSDRQAATHLSELMGPQYAYSYSDEYAGVTKFPPEPTYLTDISAAYIHDGVIYRKYVPVLPGVTPKAHLMEKYQQSVGVFQDKYNELEPGVTRILQLAGHLSLKAFVAEQMQKEGLSVIAAHWVGKVQRSGKTIDAIAYPKVVQRQLSLTIRNELTGIMGEVHRELPSEASEEFEAFVREKAGMILRQEESAKGLGALAAVSFLPNLEQFKRTHCL